MVHVPVDLGFSKFRLTGGEPLLRDDVTELVRAVTKVPGVAHIGLSTNGTRLAKLAAPLHDAGLRSVNISLDALDPAVYRRITGGDVQAALSGINAAAAAGFYMVKLNCVQM